MSGMGKFEVEESEKDINRLIGFKEVKFFIINAVNSYFSEKKSYN